MRILREQKMSSEGSEKKLAFKIILIGDPSVGKTSTIRRYSDNKFEQSYLPTIGADFNLKVVDMENLEIILTIWDIGGHDRFSMIRNFYYQGAHGGFLIFDITRKETFENIKNWHQDLIKGANAKIPAIIIANKADLQSEAKVTDEEINNLSKEMGLPWYKTSAKTGKNVDEAFNKIAELIVKDVSG
ncbi:MAG: GTP-binding protein [Candidatus Lokiarchaeota archaeon]|nr:GTP-binding protein [Candidatus Lokiarchaeota archaeon]